MGKVNLIKGDKKTKDGPRKFMVCLDFDIWASDHEDACWKLADYLEWVLTNGKSLYSDCPYKRPVPLMHVEATEIDPKSHYSCLDSGKEFKIG